MTRAQLLNITWYAAALPIAAALAAAVLGNPAWAPLAIVGVGWACLWPVVNALWEDEIRAWCARCPRYQRILTRRLAELQRRAHS